MQFEVNSFQIPNSLVDELMDKMSGNDLKVYLFIVRKTRGWQKSSDYISLSQFVEALNISKNTLLKSLENLIELDLIIKNNSKFANQYSLKTSSKIEPANEPTSSKIEPKLVQKLNTQKDILNTSIIKDTNNKNNKKINKKDLTIRETFLDKNLILEFIEHRREIKSPFTQRSLDIFINSLELLAKVHDPKTLIETAIVSGWKTVYAPKGASKGFNNSKKSILDEMFEMEDRLKAQQEKEPNIFEVEVLR